MSRAFLPLPAPDFAWVRHDYIQVADAVDLLLCSAVICRVFLAGTKYCLDLSDHGNPNPGTPVTLWGKWEGGTNQTWRFEEGAFSFPFSFTVYGLTVQYKYTHIYIYLSILTLTCSLNN